MVRSTKAKRMVNGRGMLSGASDRLTVQMSSGYTVVIHRPPINVIRAIQMKAEDLYPMPESPYEDVTTVTGQVIKVEKKDDPGYKAAVEQVQQKRLEYLMEYVFQSRLTVQGYETPEARQALIDQYKGERAELERWGTVPDDMKGLDDWQFTLRCFIVADAVDYAAVMLAASNAFDEHDITEEEIRKRVAFFSGHV